MGPSREEVCGESKVCVSVEWQKWCAALLGWGLAAVGNFSLPAELSDEAGPAGVLDRNCIGLRRNDFDILLELCARELHRRPRPYDSLQKELFLSVQAARRNHLKPPGVPGSHPHGPFLRRLEAQGNRDLGILCRHRVRQGEDGKEYDNLQHRSHGSGRRYRTPLSFQVLELPDGCWLSTSVDGGRLYDVCTWEPGPK